MKDHTHWRYWVGTSGTCFELYDVDEEFVFNRG